MATLMSDARIWAVDVRAARAAGWRRIDLWWEGLQARAKAAQMGGSGWTAAAYWIAGWAAGSTFLPRDDLRRACGLANAACVLQCAGFRRVGKAAHAEACRRWARAAHVTDTAKVVSSARSSLFHLRLAARHAGAYANVARTRLRELHGEAEAWLVNPSLEPPAETCRWVIERPPVYDDARKLVAACCLLACAQPRQGIARGRDGRVKS